MRIELSLPARINILGNPGDANEGDFATISAALELRARAAIAPGSQIILRSLKRDESETKISRDDGSAKILDEEIHPLGQHPLPYSGKLDLLKGAINRLYKFSPEFRHKYTEEGFELYTWSDVPRQSGLGGSSLFVMLTLAGLRAYYQLDPHHHNDYVLAELNQRVEAHELNITCGYADRYVPLFGGIAYIDYRAKLHQQEIHQEPYATYERLDDRVPDIPIVVATTGLHHHSGDIHGQMRPRYLAEWKAWKKQGGDEPPMVRLMSAAWETAWRGKIALLKQDWETFGELMNENHRIVDRMMRYCEFEDGAGWANNLFIERALEHGALGAKLTGAGGGGSVYALTRPGKEEKLIEVWQQTAQESGLVEASIYRPKFSKQGLILRTIETVSA